MNDNIKCTCLKALGLGARARNSLATIGVFTLEQLEQKTETQVLATPNIGRATLREIRAALQNAGTKFKERINASAGRSACMTNTELLTLARKCGFDVTSDEGTLQDVVFVDWDNPERVHILTAQLNLFAKQVAERERDACLSAIRARRQQ